MTIDGSGSRPALVRAALRSRVRALLPDALGPPAAELRPDRTPRAEVAGQVAPLAASAGLVEDGVDHPTTRDAGRSTPSAGRVEQVTDEAPLGIGQVGCLGHDRDGARRPSRGTRRSAFRTQGLSRCRVVVPGPQVDQPGLRIRVLAGVAEGGGRGTGRGGERSVRDRT